MTFRIDDGDRDKFDHSLHHYPVKKFDHSIHYYPEKIIYPEQKYYETKHLECNSIYFNGTSSYINCGNDVNLNINNAISLIGEINLLYATGWNTVISKLQSYLLRIYNNKIVFEIFDGVTLKRTDYTKGDNISLNKNHVIGGSYDGTTLKAYLDGVPQTIANTTYIGNIDTTSNELLIGSYNKTSNWINGAIKKYIIYDRALSDNEFLNIFKNKNISETGLIVDSPLKTDCSGDTIVKDLSGNGNHGTLNDCKWNCDWIREKHKVI